ncbi:hypothetical protein JCM33374_g4977 [Metschnikowia sp. JCM 33374]|nr:hypothetical protein JCM33374_g4977 [Metschnikowia sp. JCM 33374]
MNNDFSPEPQDSSLFFLSTQIQARHEDREQIDTKVSQLQRFKNEGGSPKMAKPMAMKVAKPQQKSRKKPRNIKQKPRQITSVSAFVRETLGGKNTLDTQGLLDRFLADPKKLDDFLTEVEVATAKPHLLSRKPSGQNSGLFSGPEWKSFSENLRLKFPNLSNRNKKSLKVIRRRLEDLKNAETAPPDTQDSASVWSQASRQPSDELSREDLIWLYDLDDEESKSDTSIYHADDTPNSPAILTLSQAMGDPMHPHSDVEDLPSTNDEKSDEEHSENSLQSSSREVSPVTVTGCDISLNRIVSLSNSQDISLDTAEKQVEDFISNSEDEIAQFSEKEFLEWLNISQQKLSASNPFGAQEFKPPLPKTAAVNSYSNPSESKTETLESAHFFAQKSTSRQPWNPGLISATRSLIFASPSNDNTPFNEMQQSPSASGSLTSPIKGLSSRMPKGSPKTVVNSPTQGKSRKHTPINTPSCLRVDSSPISQKVGIDSSPLTRKQFIDSSPISERGHNLKYKTPTSDGALDEDIFVSANASFPKEAQASFFEQSDGESLHFSPLTLKRKLTYCDRIEVTGRVELDTNKSTRIQLRVVHSEEAFSEGVIPNSEDEGEEGVSIIEITKNDEGLIHRDIGQNHNADANPNTSVLQVPSSPEVDQLQRPWEYRI